jgi:hypothetical protein
MTVTMRVRGETRDALKGMADRQGLTMQDLIDRLVQDQERNELLDGMQEAFDRLRSDPDAWDDELAERAAWDGTLQDAMTD